VCGRRWISTFRTSVTGYYYVCCRICVRCVQWIHLTFNDNSIVIIIFTVCKLPCKYIHLYRVRALVGYCIIVILLEYSVVVQYSHVYLFSYEPFLRLIILFCSKNIIHVVTHKPSVSNKM